jgi:hypothetical protein
VAAFRSATGFWRKSIPALQGFLRQGRHRHVRAHFATEERPDGLGPDHTALDVGVGKSVIEGEQECLCRVVSKARGKRCERVFGHVQKKKSGLGKKKKILV